MSATAHQAPPPPPPPHTHTHTHTRTHAPLLVAHAQRDSRFTTRRWATQLTTHPSAITSAQEVLQLSDANLMRDRLWRSSSRCGRSLVVCWLQFATRRGGSRGSRRGLGSLTASSTSLRTTSPWPATGDESTQSTGATHYSVVAVAALRSWRHSRRQFELDKQGLYFWTWSACSETAIVPATGGTNKSMERGSSSTECPQAHPRLL